MAKSKKKGKLMLWITAAIAILVAIMLVLLIPAVSDKVGSIIGWTGDKVRSVAQVIAGTGVGIILISYGVTALVVPWVGIPMIVIGVGLLAWNMYGLYSSSQEIDPSLTDQ